MHILETERLVIRPFIEEDWIDLYDYQSQSDIMKYEPMIECNERSCKEEAIRRSLDPSYFAITLRDHNKVIGSVYFAKTLKEDNSYLLCCSLNSYYENDDYALEASKAVMKYGFEALGVDKIYPKCHKEHKVSCDLFGQLKSCFIEQSSVSTKEGLDVYHQNTHIFLQEEWIGN